MNHDSSDGRTFIGSSPAACLIRAQIAAFARSDAGVLLTGASGSGKEVVARGLHDASARRMKTLVTTDCGAIADSLAEAELFGSMRGAFTGAVAPRNGLFAEANGGTLFLDEIGNAPLPLQARLLRAIESGEIRPVGASLGRAVDVRVIAATNVDLGAEVRSGRFREDLLYRLDVLRIRVPTLDERRGDIPEIAEHLLARIAARTGRQSSVSRQALEALTVRPWPGQVRQLRNALEHAVAMAQDDVIEPSHLPPLEALPLHASAMPSTWRRWLEEHERAFLLGRLEANGWNRSATAREVGLSRQALHDKLRRHELRPRLVSPEPTVATIAPMTRLASAEAG